MLDFMPAGRHMSGPSVRPLKGSLWSELGGSVSLYTEEPETNTIRGSTPALVGVSLSKTPNPEMLPVAVSTVCDCKSLWILKNAAK